MYQNKKLNYINTLIYLIPLANTNTINLKFSKLNIQLKILDDTSQIGFEKS